jgi:hypothetical protein
MKPVEQSKSDIVRAYINRRPNATATEIVKGVNREFGVKVSPSPHKSSECPGGRIPDARQARLDQGQSSARATRLARSGLRST